MASTPARGAGAATPRRLSLRRRLRLLAASCLDSRTELRPHGSPGSRCGAPARSCHETPTGSPRRRTPNGFCGTPGTRRQVGPVAFTRRVRAASPGGSSSQLGGACRIWPSAVRTVRSPGPGATIRVLSGILGLVSRYGVEHCEVVRWSDGYPPRVCGGNDAYPDLQPFEAQFAQ